MTKPFNEDSRLAAEALRWQANEIQYGRTSPYEKEHGTHHRMRPIGEAIESGRLAVVEVALVERLVAALDNCAKKWDHSDGSGPWHIANEALAAAKAAGFGVPR